MIMLDFKRSVLLGLFLGIAVGLILTSAGPALAQSAYSWLVSIKSMTDKIFEYQKVNTTAVLNNIKTANDTILGKITRSGNETKLAVLHDVKKANETVLNALKTNVSYLDVRLKNNMTTYWAPTLEMANKIFSYQQKNASAILYNVWKANQTILTAIKNNETAYWSPTKTIVENIFKYQQINTTNILSNIKTANVTMQSALKSNTSAILGKVERSGNETKGALLGKVERSGNTTVTTINEAKTALLDKATREANATVSKIDARLKNNMTYFDTQLKNNASAILYNVKKANETVHIALKNNATAILNNIKTANETIHKLVGAYIGGLVFVCKTDYYNVTFAVRVGNEPVSSLDYYRVVLVNVTGGGVVSANTWHNVVENYTTYKIGVYLFKYSYKSNPGIYYLVAIQVGVVKNGLVYNGTAVATCTT